MECCNFSNGVLWNAIEMQNVMWNMAWCDAEWSSKCSAVWDVWCGLECVLWDSVTCHLYLNVMCMAWCDVEWCADVVQ